MPLLNIDDHNFDLNYINYALIQNILHHLTTIPLPRVYAGVILHLVCLFPSWRMLLLLLLLLLLRLWLRALRMLLRSVVAPPEKCWWQWHCFLAEREVCCPCTEAAANARVEARLQQLNGACKLIAFTILHQELLLSSNSCHSAHLLHQCSALWFYSYHDNQKDRHEFYNLVVLFLPHLPLQPLRCKPVFLAQLVRKHVYKIYQNLVKFSLHLACTIAIHACYSIVMSASFLHQIIQHPPPQFPQQFLTQWKVGFPQTKMENKSLTESLRGAFRRCSPAAGSAARNKNASSSTFHQKASGIFARTTWSWYRWDANVQPPHACHWDCKSMIQHRSGWWTLSYVLPRHSACRKATPPG